MTITQRRRRAADRKAQRGRVVFVSYAHREPVATCPCNICRWEREPLCSFCHGDMTPDPCPWCGGTGWQPV